MSIQIDKPELEALILMRMKTGAFEDAQDMLLQTLRSAPFPKVSMRDASMRTGAELVEAMQAMPYKDIDIEPSRPHLPVRNVSL